MGVSTSAVLFMLRAHKQDEPSVSVDDIEHLLEAGRAEGVLEAITGASGCSRSIAIGRANGARYHATGGQALMPALVLIHPAIKS